MYLLPLISGGSRGVRGGGGDPLIGGGIFGLSV